MLTRSSQPRCRAKSAVRLSVNTQSEKVENACALVASSGCGIAAGSGSAGGEILGKSGAENGAAHFRVPRSPTRAAPDPIARRTPDMELAKIDIDANPGLAQRFQVLSIPAVKAFRSGEVVEEFVGLVSAAQMETFLDKLVPSKVDMLNRKQSPIEDGAIARLRAIGVLK